MNHHSTRPAPLSMNEFTTVYCNSYIFEIIYKYFVVQNIEIPGNKTEALVVLSIKVT